jgi:hypothetical protein
MLAAKPGVTYTVILEGTIADDDGSLLDPTELESLLDVVMDEMDKLGGVQDPDIDAALTTGRVSFSVDVPGGAPSKQGLQAFLRGLAAIRTALHAAMIATPDWEDAERDGLEKARASLADGEMSVRPQRSDLVDA